jgi:hypothetical protein
VLDGDHPPGGERPAVADAVDVVQDRDRRVAGTQEVGVERVDPALRVDGAGGGHEGLARDLAAEDPLAILVGLPAPEDVLLDLLEVEQLQKLVECRSHGRGAYPSTFG